MSANKKVRGEIMRISEREKLVLNAIVDYYLTVGDTIGSRTLVKKYGIELSSATIRNVMADLEDMGFIEKTHTSSGRIPTDMGYKYYLTELLKVEKITQEEIENISNVYNRRVDELENILKKTSTLLSKLTNYAGIAVEPKPDNKKVSRVELVYIDEYLIMAIIVMDDRRVKTKNIHLPYPITKEEVEKKADELNAKIRNNEIAINDIEKFFTESTDIIYEYDDEDELSKYFINNLPSMLKNENIAGVTDVIEFFNERKDIRELFEKLIEQKAQENSKSNVNVILGDELGIKELEDFSFVYSIYDIGGAQGIIGVMGPKRMAYSKTMGLINHVSREGNNFKIIYNTTPFEQVIKKDIPEDNWKTDKIKIFTVRSIEERANIDLLIELAKRKRNYDIKVAGKGPLLEKYREKIRKNQLENIELLGYIPDEEVRKFYETADLVTVLAKYGEGFGLPIIEGYLYNKPVFASDVCAIPEIIIDKAFLVKNNVEDLENKIEKYYEEIPAYNFKKYYEENFSYDKILEKYRQIYDRFFKIKKGS